MTITGTRIMTMPPMTTTMDMTIMTTAHTMTTKDMTITGTTTLTSSD